MIHVAFALNPQRAAICGATILNDPDHAVDAKDALGAARAGALDATVTCNVCRQLVLVSLEEGA